VGLVVYRAIFSDGDEAWEQFKETFSRMGDQSFERLALVYSSPDDIRMA
jgi:hypothetical protein